jgi:hypothetical protein
MEDKRKLVQFASTCSLLNKGKPMINYEHFKLLFNFLKFHSIPNKKRLMGLMGLVGKWQNK